MIKILLLKNFCLFWKTQFFRVGKMKVKYFIEYYNIYVSVKNTILECFTYTRDNTIKTIHKLKR